MAKSLFLTLSIFLPLFLSLTSTHAQLLQPSVVPSAACGSLNIIPGLSSPAMPLWPSPYPAIRPYYAASPWASPSICSNLAAISQHPACRLASPYAYSNVAAISSLAAYNVDLATASPVLNAPALNLLQANQYMVNQFQAHQLLSQQQANQLLHQQTANQILSQMEANQLLNQLQANQALNQQQANQLLSAAQANQLLNTAAYAPYPASRVAVV